MLKHHTVEAWTDQGCLNELYRYAPGPADCTVRHSHDEYQFCLSLNFPGQYFYRGAYIPVPSGALSVIHPGELHSAHDPCARDRVAAYRVLQVPVALLEELTSQMGICGQRAPFFTAVTTDGDLVRLFGAYHRGSQSDAPGLQREDALRELLSRWLARHSDVGIARDLLAAPRSVSRARDYLMAHLGCNVSTAMLAEVSELTPYRLHRLFERAYGLPPHRYLLRARLERAKRLLAAGVRPVQVANDLGFADQSHFGRHFRRWTGISPGCYTGRAAKTF
ncbi:MAG: helix-turn-helix transcriptional regulator [Gemmatimonadaceae bacterium]|nr:helix-turn-helix transcriptional regulator [Gloeobacterales cyanobacterium ES-bin-141]